MTTQPTALHDEQHILTHSGAHADAGAAPAQRERAVLRVPKRWLRFLRRVLGLPPGRYIIVVSVSSDACDWSVQQVGKVER